MFSNGGNYKTAIAIGEKIRAFGNDIAVVEQCLSSCAEFLLPAAKSIHAVNKPLIGFHKNPEILNFLKKSAGSNYCSDSDFGANEQRQFLAKMGKPTSSWRSILLRLDDSVYEAFNPIEGTCTTDKILYRHTMWYPTTTQLREIFGLRINGAVCADSYDCFSQKLRSKRKKTVVVGNEIYETGFSVKHVGRAKIK